MIKIIPLVLIITVLSAGLFFISKNHIRKDVNRNTKQVNNLANPASVYCAKKGGTTVIKTLGNGAQYGLCEFGPTACEEWAMYRGECPIGGIQTAGYDNIGQMYCAWLGGKTLAVPNSQCTLPDGTICSTDALYQGTCPSY